MKPRHFLAVYPTDFPSMPINALSFPFILNLVCPLKESRGDMLESSTTWKRAIGKCLSWDATVSSLTTTRLKEARRQRSNTAAKSSSRQSPSSSNCLTMPETMSMPFKTSKPLTVLSPNWKLCLLTMSLFAADARVLCPNAKSSSSSLANPSLLPSWEPRRNPNPTNQTKPKSRKSRKSPTSPQNLGSIPSNQKRPPRRRNRKRLTRSTSLTSPTSPKGPRSRKSRKRFRRASNSPTRQKRPSNPSKNRPFRIHQRCLLRRNLPTSKFQSKETSPNLPSRPPLLLKHLL